jgi:hypothetical protein
MLDRIGVLKHACDLDLLLFFARHPRSLVTSEQLAAWLGYDLTQIAESLEALLDLSIVTRTQNRAHAARMYVFTIGASSGGWLPRLLESASTRTGRLALRDELSRRASLATDDPVARGGGQTRPSPRPRPFLARRRPDRTPGAKAG